MTHKMSDGWSWPTMPKDTESQDHKYLKEATNEDSSKLIMYFKVIVYSTYNLCSIHLKLSSSHDNLTYTQGLSCSISDFPKSSSEPTLILTRPVKYFLATLTEYPSFDSPSKSYVHSKPMISPI